MTESGRHELAVPDFFKSDAPIRKRSKIPRRDAPKLVLDFCWPLSIFEASKRHEYSPATVKGFYFRLRDLLSDPRYRKWHNFDQNSPYQVDGIGPLIVDRLLWSVYADCYLNAECQRNFLYGKRERRECQRCAILGVNLLTSLLNTEHRARCRHWWMIRASFI